MWLIPGKTKVKTEIFKGVGITDVIIGAFTLILIALLIIANFPTTLKLILGIVVLFIVALLLVRIDGEPNYYFMLHIIRYFGLTRHFMKVETDEQLLDRAQHGETEAAFNAFYDKKNGRKKSNDDKDTETKAQRKERLKKEKAERKVDDKLLKDKNVSKEEKDAIWMKRAQQSAQKKKERRSQVDGEANWEDMENISAFTAIKDDFIVYGPDYYGAAIEIKPVEFRFFSKYRRVNSIESGLGRILRSISPQYAANIVKLDRPLHYEAYEAREFERIDELKRAYEQGMIAEDELQSRVEIIYDRIHEIQSYMTEQKVIVAHYYLVLFDSDRAVLNNAVRSALDNLQQAELPASRLDSKELAVFLKYTNAIDFDESEVDKLPEEDYGKWAMPEQIDIRVRTVEVNHMKTHNMRITQFPMLAGDAWLAYVMSVPSTKVVIKCRPMDRAKSIRNIDRSLNELKVQYSNTNVESKILELRDHINSLSNLLETLQNDSESLVECNVYVTAYDYKATIDDPKLEEPKKSERPRVADFKKTVKRFYSESNFRLHGLDFQQLEAYIGSQVSGYDPLAREGRGIPSNSLSAAYPWIYANASDIGGIKMGSSDNVPVFIDFFRRDNERINSNMVIIGKSGSGKSYATKSLLANLAAEDSKIFILDPENEYAELAENLHGKFINVGNAQYGRLNPFHIMTALDDEDNEEGTVSGSYSTHLQFLEEFFKQIIPDCEKDAMEYLNSIIDRMYTNMGITMETDLRKLRPEDYPVFDDLYDAILQEFQQTDNEYIRSMLRVLMNYIAKFSTGGRNANIWNGPSTVTTDENFSVFNFQSLLANRNGTIANAQMLLVLKYIDNEIIKNRDYNIKNHMNRKIVVVIDEAHVFIDEKYPIALDFMFQMAKRIRKYNGMQIVITQNIKDFVGSEELARKSTAIINACQYSLIFALAPNDMDDLCKLYEKAGGINELEQEKIITAPRGQAFTVLGPQSRTFFKVEVPTDIVDMFQEPGFVSNYFHGEDGQEAWDALIEESRSLHDAKVEERMMAVEEEEQENLRKNFVSFEEITEDELYELQVQKELEKQKKLEEKNRRFNLAKPSQVTFEEVDDFEDFEIPEIPDDPAEFEAMKAAAAVGVVAAGVAPVVGAAVESSQAVTPAVGEMTVSQAVTPVVPAPQPVSTSTESVLAQFMERFTFDAISSEVEKQVQYRMEREMAANRAALEEAQEAIAQAQEAAREAIEQAATAVETTAKESAPAVEAPVVEAPTVTTVTGGGLSLGSIFDLAGDSSVESSGDIFDEDGNFDFLAMLSQEADRLNSTSPIEQMELYGEDIIDITLDDLTLYVVNMRKSGMM